MPVKIKPSQAAQVQKLVSHCCNWDKGNCLLLSMACSQQLSYTITSRELVRQVPSNQRFPAADHLKGAAPNPSEERIGL